MALHAELRFGVRLFREPDAGNPPVRFDEREEETELSQTGLRRRGESPANRHREATVTAPLLDSTSASVENILLDAGYSAPTRLSIGSWRDFSPTDHAASSFPAEFGSEPKHRPAASALQFFTFRRRSLCVQIVWNSHGMPLRRTGCSESKRARK